MTDMGILSDRLVGYGVGRDEANDILSEAFNLGAASTSKPKRGTRFGGGHYAPTEWVSWALDAYTVSHPAVATEYAKFRDYWQAKPGKDGIKLDWLATWRNWCRTAFKGREKAAQTGPDLLQQTAADGRVRVPQDSDEYRSIARKRREAGGIAPFTGRDGYAWVSKHELDGING